MLSSSRKRYGTIVLLIGLLVLAGCGPTPSIETLAQGESSRTVAVTGSGRVEAQPDVAMIVVGVQTQAEEAEQALSQTSERMQALIAALKEAGVADEDIQTQAVRLFPRYEQPKPEGPEPMDEEPTVVGYEAVNTVEVRVRELDALGELMSAATQAGGNRIESVRFELSDPTTYVDQARAAAWEDAQHKAEQWADLAGVELGVVATVDETSRTPVRAVEEAIRGQGGATVPIEPGTQSVEVTVRITWELE